LEEWLCGIIDGRIRDVLLYREIFYKLKKAKHLIERWKWEYPVPGRCNRVRLHSSFGYTPTVPAEWIAALDLFKAPSLT
jgi:hypothetical protein